jgi:hypothetical protein
MPDAKQICNLGLGKIGATTVASLAPPKTTVEKLCAANYVHWRNSELRKRRWVFATEVVQLAQVAVIPNTELPFKFALPGDYLRPVRPWRCGWVIRGQFLYSASNKVELEYIRKCDDNELTDENFVDVLAWRVAMELSEPATQSNSKIGNAAIGYKDAIAEAGRLNAFILDPTPVDAPDEDYSWVHARYNQYG